MSKFALRIYQIQENDLQTDIEIISATEKVYDPYGLIGAATEDFAPLDVSPIEEVLEIEEAVYRMGNMDLTVSGLDDTLFNSYGDTDDMWNTPYIFEVRDASGVLFHGIIDPSTINYNARTKHTSISVVDWLYLLAEKDVEAREVFELKTDNATYIFENTNFSLPRITEEGYDLEDILQIGDIFQYKLDGTDYRTIVEGFQVDGEWIKVNTDFAPNTELREFGDDGSGRNLYHVEFGGQAEPPHPRIFPFTMQLSSRSEMGDFILRHYGNNKDASLITFELADGSVLTGQINEMDVWSSSRQRPSTQTIRLTGRVILESGNGPDRNSTESNVTVGLENLELGVGDDDTRQENLTFKIHDHHLYGVANNSDDPYDFDEIVFAIFHLDELGILKYIADSFPTTDFLLDHVTVWPKNPLESLRLMQNTHKSFLRVTPKVDASGLPRFDVNYIPRDEVNLTDTSNVAVDEVISWTESSGIDAPTAIIVRNSTEYFKPKDYGEVVGFYYNGVDSIVDRRRRGIPEGEHVVELEVNKTPAYGGTVFGGNEGEVVNDTALRRYAESYWKFYSNLKRKAQVTVNGRHHDLLGKYATFNNIEDGRTIFVTNQSINLREGTTTLEGRIGEYTPTGTSEPVARIRGVAIWPDFDGDGFADNVVFSAKYSYDPVEEDSNLTFEWSLDNFVTIESTAAIWRPTDIPLGRHTVSLRVTNSQNNTDVATRDIRVIEYIDLTPAEAYRLTAKEITKQAQSFATDIELSAIDNETIQWTNGTLEYADGTTYQEAGGSTSITGITYFIYNTDDEVVQAITDYSTASKYPIIATAKPSANANSFAMLIPVFGSMGIDTDANIKARSLSAEKIIANSISGTEIIGSSLSAIYADMGTLTAGEILVGDGTVGTDFSGWHLDADAGTITGYLSGTEEVKLDSAGRISVGNPPVDGIFINAGGITGYAGSTLQTQIRASDGKFTAGGGEMILDVEGLSMPLRNSKPADTDPASIKWEDASISTYISSYWDDKTGDTVIILEADRIEGLDGASQFVGDADTVDGYHGSDLAARTENETILGEWTFSASTVDLINIDRQAGSGRYITYRSDGPARWRLGVDGTTESGSNSGSDFNLLRYADDGSYLGAAITIYRDNGLVNIFNDLQVDGNIGINRIISTWDTGLDIIQGHNSTLAFGSSSLGARGTIQLWGNAYDDPSTGDTYELDGPASKYVQVDGEFSFRVAPSGLAGEAITWTKAVTITNDGNLLMSGDGDRWLIIDAADASTEQAGLSIGEGGLESNAQFHFYYTGDGRFYIGAGWDAANDRVQNEVLELFYQDSKARFKGNIGVGNVVSLDSTLVVGRDNTTDGGVIEVARGAKSAFIDDAHNPFIYTTRSSFEGWSTSAELGNLVIQPRTSAKRSIVLATGLTNTEARLVVDGDGNIGINTHAPSSMLHIDGGDWKVTANDHAIRTSIDPSRPALAFDRQTYSDTTGIFVYDDTGTSLDGVFRILNGGGRNIVLDGGNIGIGIDQPTGKLHVKHSSASAGGTIFAAQHNSASSNLWRFHSGISGLAHERFAISADGDNIFVIDSANDRVGINVDSPQADLHVVNDSGNAITLNESVSHGAFIQNKASGSNWSIFDAINGNHHWRFGIHTFNSGAGFVIHDQTIGVNRITIDTNGAVNFNKTIGSDEFASGALGSGWRIEYTGAQSYIEADNLRIRGTFRSHIFQKDIIRASNGYFFFSDSAALTEDITVPAGTAGSVGFQIYVKEPVFQDKDILIYKDINDDGSEGTEERFRVSNVVGETTRNGETIYRYGVVLEQDSAGSTMKSGGTVVRIGNIGTSRQGSIYADASGPFIDVYDGVNSSAAFNSLDKVKVRLGQLTGITDPDYGTLSGYGLYGENVFLRGSIANTSGTWILKDDGSGQVASGKIDWETDGSMTISGWDIQDTRIYKTLNGRQLIIDAANMSIRVETDALSARWISIGRIFDTNGGWQNRYGVGAFDDNGARVFELGDVNEIAGWTFTNNRLINNNVVLAADYTYGNLTGDFAWFGYTNTIRGWIVQRSTGQFIQAIQNDNWSYPTLRIYDGTVHRVVIGDMNRTWNGDPVSERWDGVGFKIYDGSGNLMFGTTSSNDLYFNGNGTFTGTITSSDANIGGWIIDSTSITSQDNHGGRYVEMRSDADSIRVFTGLTGAGNPNIISFGNIYASGAGWTTRFGIGAFDSNGTRIFELGDINEIAKWSINADRLYNSVGNVAIASDYNYNNLSGDFVWFGHTSNNNFRGMIIQRVVAAGNSRLTLANYGVFDYPSLYIGDGNVTRLVIGDMNYPFNSKPVEHQWGGVGIQVFDSAGDLIFGQKTSDSVFVKGGVEVTDGINLTGVDALTPSPQNSLVWYDSSDNEVASISGYIFTSSAQRTLELRADGGAVDVYGSLISNGTAVFRNSVVLQSNMTLTDGYIDLGATSIPAAPNDGGILFVDEPSAGSYRFRVRFPNGNIRTVVISD